MKPGNVARISQVDDHHFVQVVMDYRTHIPLKANEILLAQVTDEYRVLKSIAVAFRRPVYLPKPAWIPDVVGDDEAAARHAYRVTIGV